MTELAPGSSIGPYPYRIIRGLRKPTGGMSNVYLASVEDAETNQPQGVVAVKIMATRDSDGLFLRTMENEVELLRSLKHPGIVRLFPIQKEGLRNLPYMAQANLSGHPWFSVMEYLGGGSLAELIEQKNTLDIGLSLEIVRNLAATLDYLHSRQQVHLDIKPGNILFRGAPSLDGLVQPVLIDFGVSRAVGQSGLEAGTLQWSSPERIPSEPVAGLHGFGVRPHPSMDIYALGVVLYQMVTGRLPFEGRTRKDITPSILGGTPVAPSEHQPLVKPELDELILSMISKDPSKRPTAGEVAIASEVLAIRFGYSHPYGQLSIANSARAPELNMEGKVVSKGRLAIVALIMILAAGTLFLFSLQPWKTETVVIPSPNPSTLFVPSRETEQSINTMQASPLPSVGSPGPTTSTSKPPGFTRMPTVGPTVTLIPTRTPVPNGTR